MKGKKSTGLSQRERRRSEKENEWVLSREAMARLKALEEMPDEEIDFSDIPEQLDWSDAVVGLHYHPYKKQISLRVDVDILIFFQMMGKGYQTKMNQALREYMMQDRRKYWAEQDRLDEEREKKAKIQTRRRQASLPTSLRSAKTKKKSSKKLAVPKRAPLKKKAKKRMPGR